LLLSIKESAPETKLPKSFAFVIIFYLAVAGTLLLPTNGASAKAI